MKPPSGCRSRRDPSKPSPHAAYFSVRVADRRPEPGHRRPTPPAPPAATAPGDLALASASPQCSTRSGRPAVALLRRRTSPAASTPASSRRASSASTGTAPSSSSMPAVARRARRAGATPVAITTTSASSARSVGDHRERVVRSRSIRSHRARRGAAPRPPPPASRRSARRPPVAEPGDVRRGSSLTSVTACPRMPQRGGDLAADEARADHHDRARSPRQPPLQLADVVERCAARAPPGSSAPGHRQAGRLGAGGEHAAS